MKPLLKFIDVAYSWLLRGANSLQAPFLLVVRLYWGWQFWQAGHGKLVDIGKVVDYFTSLGIPAPSLNAHFIALLEKAGGILLIVGLGSRLDDIDPALKKEIENHLKTCRRCSLLHDTLRKVLIVVGDERAFEIPLGYSERPHAFIDRQIG